MDEGTRLILNDGTTIEGGRAGLADRFLWLWLPGWTIQEAAELAFDTEKTKRIWFVYGEDEEEYRGFTSCQNIMMDGAEASLCLTREG